MNGNGSVAPQCGLMYLLIGLPQLCQDCIAKIFLIWYFMVPSKRIQDWKPLGTLCTVSVIDRVSTSFTLSPGHRMRSEGQRITESYQMSHQSHHPCCWAGIGPGHRMRSEDQLLTILGWFEMFNPSLDLAKCPTNPIIVVAGLGLVTNSSFNLLYVPKQDQSGTRCMTYDKAIVTIHVQGGKVLCFSAYAAETEPIFFHSYFFPPNSCQVFKVYTLTLARFSKYIPG